jgi:hypothetical protein
MSVGVTTDQKQNKQTNPFPEPGDCHAWMCTF